MTSASKPSLSDLGKIRAMDTCSVSNAIERLDVRPRNEGFVVGALRCQFPNFEPMLGYAVTGLIRSMTAPMTARCYYDRIDFWEYVTTIPEPRVLVLQDVDDTPGVGAFVGEMHATIALALKCVGYVTNGAVRDLAAVQELGFQLFAGSVAVSHSYAHLVEFGQPVEIGGLRIAPGDLLHGDRHGVQMIPWEIASEIPEQAAKIETVELELKKFCRSPQFSLNGLSDRLKLASKDCL
jgi:regulator of RNase E activity RraA